nr:tetratricopeptide repeat protein [Kiritimatiellia bacterium]
MSASSFRRVAPWMVAAVMWLVSAPAQSPVDDDFEFAKRLISAGFADYAGRLVDEAVRLNPELKDRAVISRVDVLSASGKFDEAEKLLATLPGQNPKAQAARLVLAKRHYAARNPKKAQAMFEEFFKQIGDAVPGDADLRREYQDASYQFGQMMENFGNYAAAADAYLRILKTNPENDIARRVRSETAALLVRAAREEPDKRDNHLNRAYKLCEEIQWDPKGAPDLWFVNSIATMALVEHTRGKNAAAEKLIRQNLDLMSGVDDLLREAEIPIELSPLAPARFLLGDIREREGKNQLKGDRKKGGELLANALQQYVNVFAKYGGSDWGLEAGDRAEQLFAFMVENEFKLKPIDFGKYSAEAERARAERADTMFLRENFEEAARLYFSIINRAPAQAGVFANLMVCLLRTDRTRDLDATADHIAERYAGNDTAGLGLLSAAKVYFDTGKTNECVALYMRYVEGFPRSDKTSSILFLTANMLNAQGRTAEAAPYLERLIRDFKGDRNYLLALQQMGQTSYDRGDFAKAGEFFRLYVADSLPSPGRAAVQAMLADAQFRMGDFPNAAREYRTLVTWLRPQDQNPYFKTADETQRAQRLMETGEFFSGFALTRIREPKESIPQLRGAAIREMNEFIAKYPKSDLAPKALFVLGTAQLELNQVKEAAAAFDRLQKEYPQTEEGRNAGVSLVLAALDIDNRALAQSTLKGMFEGDPEDQPATRFTAAQWANVGARFAEARMPEEAARVMGKVVRTPGLERAVKEQALFTLGSSLYELKNYDESVRHLEDLLISYPNSGLFYTAKMTLGRAFRD